MPEHGQPPSRSPAQHKACFSTKCHKRTARRIATNTPPDALPHAYRTTHCQTPARRIAGRPAQRIAKRSTLDESQDARSTNRKTPRSTNCRTLTARRTPKRSPLDESQDAPRDESPQAYRSTPLQAPNPSAPYSLINFTSRGNNTISMRRFRARRRRDTGRYSPKPTAARRCGSTPAMSCR